MYVEKLTEVLYQFEGFILIYEAMDAKKNKSDSKRRNTLSCLDQYTCKVLRLWNSRDRETV